MNRRRRHVLSWLTLGTLAVTAAAVAQIGPSTAPATRPARAPIAVRTPTGELLPATGPVAVPYTLSGTNHLVVRLKINGHGPYNFVVDTGAPTMFVAQEVADQIGLKPDPIPVVAHRRRGRRASTRPAATTAPTTQPGGWATIDDLELEGGLSLSKVKCLVLTPYQITGMNAVGIAGMPLHGLLGYSVIARFKLDIDLAKHEMLWTPQPGDFTPPPLRGEGDNDHPHRGETDPREAQLESMGDIMRVLGPLVKMSMPGPAKPRGLIGLSLLAADGGDVSVDQVLGDSPAAKAGVRTGDVLVSIDDKPVHSVADAERATAHYLPDRDVDLVVRRRPATQPITLTLTTGEGL